jgi:uncharacterized membrane protein
MSKITSRFFLFAAIFVVVAYFTGKNDAKEVFEFLSSHAKGDLVEHAKLGKYLAISMVAIALIKMFACFKKIFKLELLSVLLLGVLSVGILSQGKMGGELTYEYGAHVEKHAEGQACLAEAAAMDEDEDDEDED